MKVITIDGKDYRLPNGLNPFQQELYVHLINWKWRNITKEPGTYAGIAYDVILPEVFQGESTWPHIYPDIAKELRRHRAKNDFRIHQHFYHMASSQTANINLFLPVLLHRNASSILGTIKSDFASLATKYLDGGYCIEYWGGNSEDGGVGSGNTGPLNDKSQMSGTDSDIAIAYHNHEGELCLWLIEHKLTEVEFTTCGGFRSNGRKERHDCSRSFSEILKNKNTCYYHDVRKFNYWNITETNRDLFVNHAKHAKCPFQGGINQLWRNQLLALAVEQDERQLYQHASFSVVKHQNNTHLDRSLDEYRDLVSNNPRFSILTSADVLRAAESSGDTQLGHWVSWYKELYNL